MASPQSEFDALRLTRDARSAGEAFALDQVEAETPPAARRSPAFWLIAGVAILAAGLGYGLL